MLNLTIIELGSGTGFCGLVAWLLGSNRVILTDEFVDLCSVNMERAKLQFPDISTDLCCREVEWGNRDHSASIIREMPDTVDVIIASEITPMISTHAALVSTIRDFNPKRLILTLDMKENSASGELSLGKSAREFLSALGASDYDIIVPPTTSNLLVPIAIADIRLRAN